MRKGRVVLVPFPFTNLSGKTIRPAILLHVSRGDDCIVAFITTRLEIRKSPYTVTVEPSSKDGLKSRSLLRLDKIATLQKCIILGEIGTLEQTTLGDVHVALRRVFGI